jgi:peptide/nickel transport system substrate-binding protein
VLSSQWNATISALFGRLTIIKPGFQKPSDGEVEGNHAEAWEFSPDRLTVAFKLRPNMTWHQIAPVNGRGVDVQDVLFSADRLFAQGTARHAYSNALNPGAPITSVTAPDSRTIVFKLAFPMVTLPALLAFEFGGNFHIVPRELDGQFDIRHRPIGSGPWYLAEHVPSSRMVFKRHPGHFDKERPYADESEIAVIPEYAAGLAQFKTGALHVYGVRPEDILVTKQDVPQLSLYQTDVSAAGNTTFFGWRPIAHNVFRDERVRQAFSMSTDRDLFIDTFYNVPALEKEGIPVETRWNSALAADYFEGWWLNPQSKDFGPNARYFEHNVAEAKKLMAAAGHANGVEVKSTVATGSYGPTYPKEIEVIEGMVGEAGFRFVTELSNYSTEFQPKFRDAQGDFEGISYKPLLGGNTDAIENLSANFSKLAGSTFTGLDVQGKGDYSGDPYIEERIVRGRAEPDTEKRKAIAHELQRHLGKTQYMIRHPGGASGLSLAWPAVRNYLLYRGPLASFQGGDYYQWLDATKPPFGS